MKFSSVTMPFSEYSAIAVYTPHETTECGKSVFFMRKERGSQITYGGYWNVAGTLGPAIG